MSVSTVEEAKRLAQMVLRRGAPAHMFTLIEAATREHDFGWTFAYAPAAYLKSGDVADLAPGSGPLVVEFSGEVHFLPSSRPPAIAIANFEKKWRAQHEHALPFGPRPG